MDNAQSEIRAEIESTRAGMVEKISTLEQRLEGAITDAKRSVDPKYQTQKRPWLMTGLSLAAGYVMGRIVFGRSSPKPQVIVPDNWPERAGINHQKAGLIHTVSGMVSGVVTAVGVALARELASNLLSKRHGREQDDGASSLGTGFNDRHFQ